MPQRTFESIRKSREKGIAVYITAFFMFLMIPIVGLAIDGGYAFVIRSRLSAAADAAALAAGRNVNLQDTQTNADTQATAAATNYFNANFPSGYMNTGTTRTITPTFTVQTDSGGNPTGVLSIQMVVSVQAPTYFMKWVGVQSLTVNAAGTATRRNLVMELVLDISSSMGTRTGAQVGHIPATLNASDSACQAMVYATAQFIKYFSPYDYIGEISFDATVSDDYSASTNYWTAGASGMDNKLQNLNCTSNTNTTAALYKAYQDIKTANQKLAQNVIVLFTDGVPNAVDGTFTVRTKVDSRMSPASGGGTGCQDTSGTTLCTNGVTNAVVCPGASGCVAGTASAGGSGTGGMAVCTTTNATVTGVIEQWAAFAVAGGTLHGLDKMFSTDSTPSTPSGCPGNGSASLPTQTIAYIPNTDYFGNSMINIQTGASTTATSPWFQWIYGDTNSTSDHVNYQCAPTSATITTGNTRCKNLGDSWTNHPALGAGADNNTFQGGPYKGYLRPDTPNSIGVASMTAATNQAFNIRADSTYNPTIHTVYLQGNGTDPVDRTFLQIVANSKTIAPIIYQSNPPCPTGVTGCVTSGSAQGTYDNPYYQSGQQVGIWAATANTLELTSMFQQIASSLLRISQ